MTAERGREGHSYKKFSTFSSGDKAEDPPQIILRIETKRKNKKFITSHKKKREERAKATHKKNKKKQKKTKKAA